MNICTNDIQTFKNGVQIFYEWRTNILRIAYG